jgi:antitoxin component YwqK of YwqJK toxin-antitoxin module
MTKTCSSKFLLIAFVFALGINFPAMAQNGKPKKKDEGFSLEPTTDLPPTIDFSRDEDEERLAPKKKKRKKKVFYGIKTKKGFVKSGFGGNVRMETFYYLKDYTTPDPFVRDIYWYDKKKRTIRTGQNIDKKYGKLLHGPYKKMAEGEVVEEGIFYKGTKNGRWEVYDKRYFLLDKVKYFRGWPKESSVKYYDEERTKLKEIIPIVHGETEGNYFMFHDNGQIAVKGEFREGQKIGVWTEYYKGIRRKKKEIQFRQDPYDNEFVPYVVREWDDKGKLLYDRELEKRRTARN